MTPDERIKEMTKIAIDYQEEKITKATQLTESVFLIHKYVEQTLGEFIPAELPYMIMSLEKMTDIFKSIMNKEDDLIKLYEFLKYSNAYDTISLERKIQYPNLYYQKKGKENDKS